MNISKYLGKLDLNYEFVECHIYNSNTFCHKNEIEIINHSEFGYMELNF